MRVPMDRIQAIRYAFHRQDQTIGYIAERFDISRLGVEAVLCLPNGTDLSLVRLRLLGVDPDLMERDEVMRIMNGE